eukprot:m.220439 g.220439  ORF g.220439 m.220439 type:complete len:56 (-) comp25785_c0_seq2:139-306(-)
MKVTEHSSPSWTLRQQCILHKSTTHIAFICDRQSEADKAITPLPGLNPTPSSPSE